MTSAERADARSGPSSWEYSPTLQVSGQRAGSSGHYDVGMDHVSDAANRLDSVALLKLSASAGYDVSARMLETFRAQGLLPRPTRTGHRGRAPVWLYPAGADRQLIALLGWRERTKDPNLLRVLLWLDGFPIPLTGIRDALTDGLRSMLDLLEREISAQAERHGLDASKAVHRDQALGRMASALAAKRGQNALPRHARVGARQRARAVELMLRGFALGEQVEVTTDDATAVERVLGLSPGRRHRVDGAGPWLTGPPEELFDGAEIVAIPQTLAAVLDATDAELDTARQMVAVLWRYLPLMARMLAALFDDENYAGMSGLARLDQQPELVLILVPAIISMLRAGWEQNLRAIIASLAELPDISAQTQHLLELPARTVDANLAGQPIEVQQRARRLVRAAIDGKLAHQPPHP